MDIYKYSKILLLFLVANSLLSACGGNSTETSTPTVAPLPIVGTIKPSFANNQSIQARKIVSVVAANASGEFTHPFDNENFTGNLLASINVSDPDGISAVALSFNQQTDVQYLCQNSSTCTGTSFHKTQTSINPANFGLYTGPVTIGLWVMDVNQNQMQVDSITVNWQYRKIVDVNAVRSSDGTSISLNWMPQNALLKYNIYVATQPNVNNNNYLTLTDGQARLALAQPAQTFTGLQANKSYYFFITGVDSSGESAFSSTIRMDQYAGQANTPPVANDDVVKSPEDTILTSNLLDNDSDSDNNPLTVNSIPIRAPFYGQLTLQENGDFSYVPQLNFSGNDSFEYEIQDGQGGFSQARVDIIVSSSNDAPQAVDDTYSTAKNQSITVTAPGVLSNDTDIDGDQLSINTTPITNTTHGSLVLDTDGGFTYTPNTDFVGIDRFVYQVNDPLGLNDNAQVTINVGGQNTPPTAVNDSYNTSQNTTLIVNGSPLPSILANDSDADGDTIQLSSTLISNVTNGSLTIDVNGFFTYIPNTNFSGTDSFVYQITDGQGGSAQATVTISVNSVNQAPVAVDDVASVDEDTTVSIDVLNNDSDGDGDTLTITSWQASNGTATLNTNKLDYTPNSNFNGADTLTYTIDDGNSHTSSAKVIITINPINDNPVAIDDTASMISGGSVIITVLDNDSDVDGDPLTVTSASSDSGSAIVNNDNTITFSGAITGTALITYSISDGNGGNATALITVTVNAANQSPTAVADSYSIDQDTTLSVDGVKILGLLDNDSDPENDSLTVNTAPITDVSNGTLTLNSDGTFTYIPNNGYSGSDSFEYQIDDGNSNLASALVTITINKVNTVPIANPDFYSLQPNSSISVDGTTLAHLLSNDTDADGDTLNYTGVTSTVENGTLNDSTDSTFSYIPNSNFTGVDSFFYDISDGAGGTSKALTSLTVSRLIWNSTKAPLISDYQGISFDGSNYHLVANGNLLGSNNATTWTKQYQNNGTALLAIASGKTTASPSLNTTVAVGQFNKNLVRQQKVNGTFFSGSWPNRVTNTSVAMQNIILNNGQFIAVGQQAVMFSSDGINWQKQTPNTAVLFHGVVKALGQLIIV